MKITDNRVSNAKVLELGDIVRGESGTYYKIIKVNGKYFLLDLVDGVTRFEDFNINDLVNNGNFGRDRNETHIKSEQVEVTFR